MRELLNPLILTVCTSILLIGCESGIQQEQKQENPATEMEKTGQINNPNEWNQLKEVVIGRWIVGTFNTPTIDTSMKNRFPYIPDAAWGYMKASENKNLFELYPEDDRMYHEEQEGLVSKLEELGVKVRRPDPMEFNVVATTQCYSRDPIITIGDKFIITNMNFEGRRQETANYRRIALDLTQNYKGEVICMPANKPGYPETNVYLEGGDVFVDGKDVYVGCSGNASNDAGIEWLRETLGNEYTVTKIPLAHHVLHLDCAMMLINEKQGVICKSDFIDFESAPNKLKNREWVEVEPEKAQIMATNGIVVNPTTVLMIDHFPEVIKQVEAMGITVHAMPFKKGNYFGGGLRCSYQPISRI
ncbi:hypothetical protein KFE98_01495 [bacterium SCSIO 12741]|nr:hypothetical protein KFE98_01495 [bacterium SCSIO 12741]